jgi:SAM-dependent methyltransferase
VAPHIVNLAIAAVVVALVAGQCRKPRWLIGRAILWTMNRSHSRVTDWGLTHVAIEPCAVMLDVGCGGGRTIQKLAAIAGDGRVCGVDYAIASVAAARRTNAGAIEAGHVEIVQGSVSHLPFAPAAFDLVTACETHYYWPNLVEDLREVRRTLKPGGRLVIIAETYRRPGAASALVAPLMRLLGGTHLSADQHRDAMTRAGFVNVAIDEERRKGWICARGQAPVAG